MKISSKTKPLMLKFVHFLCNLQILPFFIKPTNNYRSQQFITVLKSPHVNKTAQEQFEFRHYTCQFCVFTPKPFLFLLFFKRLMKLMFLGLRFEIKVLLISDCFVEKSVSPDTFMLTSLKDKLVTIKKNSDFSEKKVLKYMQLFDVFGEAKLVSVLSS